ncbi:MAG TPA: GNAT family N-acetyltransferase [Puia sp.]|nr:GNAT family N-acetyltransferase [Puia sp.]
MKLRKADFSDAIVIWKILQQAIEQRRQDGSDQWQQGYPNEQTVHDDIANRYGFVVTDNDDVIIAYAAIIFDIEPAYNEIAGQWLTNDDYAAVHRVATSNSVKGKGVATELFRLIEDLAIGHNIFSIKVDTNFDNVPMLKILNKLEYTYCGEIFFGGAPRKAFEKVLSKHATESLPN